MLRRGDLVPHFTVQTTDGRTFAYATIWQQRNLVLVLVGPAADASPYAERIASGRANFDAADAECVVTAEAIDNLPARGFVIADRWGEIVHVAEPTDQVALPTADELLEWVRFTQMRCPECEGEAR